MALPETQALVLVPLFRHIIASNLKDQKKYGFNGLQPSILYNHLFKEEGSINPCLIRPSRREASTRGFVIVLSVCCLSSS